MDSPHWEPEYPPMVFTQHDDGSVTVDRWLDRILVSVELLEGADRRYLRRDIDGFAVTVANGHARYRIIGKEPNWLVYRAERVYR